MELFRTVKISQTRRVCKTSTAERNPQRHRKCMSYGILDEILDDERTLGSY